MALTYFLTIPGLNGGSSVKGHEGAFEIEAFDFDVSALITQEHETGRAAYESLTIDLFLNSGLTGLLAKIASGLPLTSVRIEGVTETGKSVYDLTLGTVAVTAIHDRREGFENVIDSLTFDYSKFSLSTTPYDADTGMPTGTKTTFGWDIAANQPLTTTLTQPLPSGNNTGGFAFLDYFLTIDGVRGSSSAKGHQGAFELSSFDFDVSALIKATGGTDPATFSPLTVNLLLGNGLVGLLSHIAQGQPFASIQIQGVNLDGETVYDLTLGKVLLSGIHDDISAEGVDSLTFDYGQFSLTTTPQNSQTGQLGQPVAFGWDLENNKALDVTLNDPNLPSQATGGSNANVFYLTIDGLNGGSQNADHKGAFVINGFDFDVTALIDRVKGIGVSPGDFKPLTIDLELNSGLTGLLGSLTKGQHLSSIRIEGVREFGPSDDVEVYDLLLGDVTVTAVHDSRGDNELDSLTFDYSQFYVTTRLQDPKTGQFLQPVGFGWDNLLNKPLGPVLPTAPTASSTPTGSDGALTYFLTVDGVNGGSQEKNHVGAFEIAGFDFDLAAGGKPDFSPVTVDLVLESGLTGLLSHIAKGEIFSSIRIEGITATGLTAYDLKLGNVVLSDVHDVNNDGGAFDSLTIDYSKVLLTTMSPTKVASTFGWDIAANAPFQGTLSPTASAVPTGGGTDRFFLTIDGLRGDSVATDYVGAFEVRSVDFDVSALALQFGGGLQAGPPDFSSLTVGLNLNSALTRLLDQMVHGQAIESVQLEGIVIGAGNAQTVYDLRLGDVLVTKIHDSQGTEAGDSLSFDFSKFSLTTKVVNPITGQLGQPVTFGWDLPTGKAFSTPLPAADAPGSSRSAAVTDYFMTIDGVTGNSQDKNHLGAFDIEHFDLDVSALIGAGKGAAPVSFSPLTVDLFLTAGAAPLLSSITKGVHIPTVHIEGIRSTEGSAGGVAYDLTLGDVLVTRIHDASADTELDSVTFDYNEITLLMRSVDSQGSLGNPVTFHWTIADLNAAPTLALAGATTSLAENADTSSPLKIADITVSDDGKGTNTLSLSGADAGLFEIAGGALYLKAGAVLDYETNKTLDVTVSIDDTTVGSGPDDSESLSIAVTDVNAAPTLAVAGTITSLPENTDMSSRLKVADIAIADDGEGTNELALSGADAGLFEIAGGALYLRAGTVLDFEGGNATLDVTVTVTDPTLVGTPGDSKTLSIVVTDVNEAPALALTGAISTLAENTDTSDRVKVADIAVTDDALGTKGLALSGADADLFEIDGNALYLKAGTVLDFEGGNAQLDVTVAVDDPSVGGTPDDSESLSIAVTDVNEAPVLALNNVVVSVAENTDTKSAVKIADIVLTDDALGTNELSLSGLDADLFEIVGGALYLKAGTVLDFEGGNTQLDVAVAVDDPAVGNTPDDSKALSIAVADVNEAPAVSLKNVIASLAENTDTKSAMKVADIVLTDDALGAHDLSLSGADAALFEIVSGALYLKAGTVLDFESGNTTLDVAVDVDDPALPGTPDDSATVAISVTDVNAAPILTLANAVTSLVENTDMTNRLKVADITLTDDGEGTNFLTLAGADATLFEVFDGALYLKAGTVLDFESGNTRLDVTVAVDDPMVGVTPDDIEALSISITDVVGKNIVGGNGGQTLVGTTEADSIAGGNGNDVVNGDGGSDTLSGGNGNDVVNGGAGNDALDAGNGDDALNGDAGNDTLSGGNGNDTLAGGTGDDSIDAGNGDDSLKGDDGNDALSGGNGTDLLTGGAGNDTMEGGNGNDVFVFAPGFGNDRILGFDANASGGQDYLNVSAFGITKASFAARVAIADVGADTLVTIDGNAAQTIRLVGIGDATTVTQADFLL